MSFTAEVKNELVSVPEGQTDSALAQLSALIRVSGTLSVQGPGKFAVRIVTETGTVARTVVSSSRRLFDLDTSIEYRRSIMHKKRNYLLEISNQDSLAGALSALGIYIPGEGLVRGIPKNIVRTKQTQRAFLRGAFMAGGFVADPRKDFHLEIAVSGDEFAADLVKLIGTLGVKARLNHRNRHTNALTRSREIYAVYLKSSDDIITFLREIGATTMARVAAAARNMKHYRNNVNRAVNAEMANQTRSSNAAADQLALIEKAEKLIGLSALPPAVREFCIARKDNPELSLLALGESFVPPVSKSAMYHRLLRLEKIVQDLEKDA